MVVTRDRRVESKSVDMMASRTHPHEQREKVLTKADVSRRGLLKHGNPPGDPTTAPRCGAKTRHGRFSAETPDLILPERLHRRHGEDDLRHGFKMHQRVI